MKRSPLKRKTPMKRGTKRLGPGKKTLAKQSAMHYAVYRYFEERGWLNSEGERVCYCQVSQVWMTRGEAVAHHRTPRSELRKAGVTDLDAPERLIICHFRAHAWLHDNQMGRPKGTEEARQFGIVENSPANAVNGWAVEFSPQDFWDLNLHMQGKR